MGKSSINGPFSVAMLNNQRVVQARPNKSKAHITMCVAKKRLALLHFDLFCISGSYGEYVFILVIYFGTWAHSLEPRNPSKIMSISTATNLLSTFCNAYSTLSLGTRIRRNFKRTPKCSIRERPMYH